MEYLLRMRVHEMTHDLHVEVSVTIGRIRKYSTNQFSSNLS